MQETVVTIEFGLFSVGEFTGSQVCSFKIPPQVPDAFATVRALQGPCLYRDPGGFFSYFLLLSFCSRAERAAGWVSGHSPGSTSQCPFDMKCLVFYDLFWSLGIWDFCCGFIFNLTSLIRIRHKMKLYSNSGTTNSSSLQWFYSGIQSWCMSREKGPPQGPLAVLASSWYGWK